LPDVELTGLFGHPQEPLDLAVCKGAVVAAWTAPADGGVGMLVAHVIFAGKLQVVDSLTDAEPRAVLFGLHDKDILLTVVLRHCWWPAISEADKTCNVRVKQLSEWKSHHHYISITTTTSSSSS